MSTYNVIFFFFFFSRILQLEEEFIQRVCSDIIAFKPDVVFTEKGVSGETVVDNNVNSIFCFELNVYIMFVMVSVDMHTCCMQSSLNFLYSAMEDNLYILIPIRFGV